MRGAFFAIGVFLAAAACETTGEMSSQVQVAQVNRLSTLYSQGCLATNGSKGPASRYFRSQELINVKAAINTTIYEDPAGAFFASLSVLEIPGLSGVSCSVGVPNVRPADVFNVLVRTIVARHPGKGINVEIVGPLRTVTVPIANGQSEVFGLFTGRLPGSNVAVSELSFVLGRISSATIER